MAVSPGSNPQTAGQPAFSSGGDAEPADPRFAFRSALARYQAGKLLAITRGRGIETDSSRPSALAAELTDQLESPATIQMLVAGLGVDARMALSLFALTDSLVWPLVGMRHTLSTLGIEPVAAVLQLLECGLVALDEGGDRPPIDDLLLTINQEPPASLKLRVHPSAPQGVRVTRPEGELVRVEGPVGQIRESDGLEPTIKLGALWQRVGVEPLRQTQQGTLYKRDHERLQDDPVLAGPISDAVEPLPELPELWLALARRVGLVVYSPTDERLEAVPAGFWAENALHLPQMSATSWLGLRQWSEWAGSRAEETQDGLPLSFLRPALLLWLASVGDDQWVALDDLAAHLEARNPAWDRLSFDREPDSAAGTSRPRAAARGKAGSPMSRGQRAKRVLSSILLGTGYALGIIRAGEEKGTGRRVVQLTPLGRYVLALGPPPPPRPAFEHFLFVQPNLEMIAYRQGLTAPLVGRLSRFAWWTKIGAALELKLTQESVLFGLEGGITPPQMLEILTRHSQRPLPSLVPDAIERWAGRRERITFYTAATLIEFGSNQERDQALGLWSQDDPNALLAVADRFLLVENALKVPTDKIRTSGSRDYRHPPEKCVLIEPDGVTLALDPTRSDLLIDPEMARIADELPRANPTRSLDSAPPARRYMVSAASVAGRATELGVTPAQIADWFVRRTGAPPSPAIKLLLGSTSGRPRVLKARRTLVLHVPTAELLDGLLQHPATRPFLGDRLGPTTAAMADEHLEALGSVLNDLGVELNLE